MIANSHYSRMKGFEEYGMEVVGTVTSSPAKYGKQAESFNLDRYDPDKWLAAARKAGVRYSVLTTRHHDGFALWPSEYGDFNTKNYANGQDLVAKYVEACETMISKWIFITMSYRYNAKKSKKRDFPLELTRDSGII